MQDDLYFNVAEKKDGSMSKLTNSKQTTAINNAQSAVPVGFVERQRAMEAYQSASLQSSALSSSSQSSTNGDPKTAFALALKNDGMRGGRALHEMPSKFEAKTSGGAPRSHELLAFHHNERHRLLQQKKVRLATSRRGEAGSYLVSEESLHFNPFLPVLPTIKKYQ